MSLLTCIYRFTYWVKHLYFRFTKKAKQIKDYQQVYPMDDDMVLFTIIIKNYVLSFSTRMTHPEAVINKIRKKLIKVYSAKCNDAGKPCTVLPFRMFFDSKARCATYLADKLYDKAMTLQLISELAVVVDERTYRSLHDTITFLSIALPEKFDETLATDKLHLPRQVDIHYKDGDRELGHQIMRFREDTDKLIVMNYLLMLLYMMEDDTKLKLDLQSFDVHPMYYQFLNDYVLYYKGEVNNKRDLLWDKFMLEHVYNEGEPKQPVEIPEFAKPAHVWSDFTIKQYRNGSFIYVCRPDEHEQWCNVHKEGLSHGQHHPMATLGK